MAYKVMNEDKKIGPIVAGNPPADLVAAGRVFDVLGNPWSPRETWGEKEIEADKIAEIKMANGGSLPGHPKLVGTALKNSPYANAKG